MKVDIRDGPALRSVLPEAVEGYLENSGWQRRPEVAKPYSIWAKVVGSEDIDLLVPSDQSLNDYQARMADLLRDLEYAEHRSQIEIFEDLFTANADVLRVIFCGPSYRTSQPPIDTVSYMVYAAKDLLSAAACSALALEPFYPPRPPKPVADFLRRVRLEPAGWGSTGLKLSAEVPAGRRFPFEEQIPFPRAALLMLQSALSFVYSAQRALIDVNQEQLTQESIKSGASANLCEALAVLCGELSDDHSVEFAITYASALPVKAEATRQWRFRPSDREFFQALSQQLRESGFNDDYHLVGFVHAIKQPWRNKEYLVTILAWIHEKVTRVNVHLDADHGALAAQAFETRVPIECVGRLKEGKQTFTLDHPHGIKLYSYPDDPALEPLRKPASSFRESGHFEFEPKDIKKRRS